jgi:hypothetical protein
MLVNFAIRVAVVSLSFAMPTEGDPVDAAKLALVEFSQERVLTHAPLSQTRRPGPD